MHEETPHLVLVYILSPVGVFLQWMTLEQGLGFTNVSRGRPCRRPGEELSSPYRRVNVIIKIIRSLKIRLGSFFYERRSPFSFSFSFSSQRLRVLLRSVSHHCTTLNVTYTVLNTMAINCEWTRSKMGGQLAWI